MTEPRGASAAVMRQVKTIRKSFLAYVQGWGALVESRAELAPRFMRAFRSSGMSLPDFVRLLDPTVPTRRADYRRHRSLMAAEYLRTLVTPAARRRRAQAARAPQMRDVLARTLATIVSVVADPEVVWRALAAECIWTPTRVQHMRERVAETQPLLRLPRVRSITPQIVHIGGERARPKAA